MMITPPSPAERTVMTACTGVAACGGLLAFEALQGLQAMVQFVGPVAGDWISAFCAAAGALIAVVLLRERFGGKGLIGALNALFAALLATLLMGVIAGTMVLPIFGTMFGPWLIITAALAKPWLLVPWAMSLYGQHLALAEYHAEQDTLFNFVKEFDAT